MRVYRAVWWLVCSAVAAPAIAIASLAWTPTAVAALFLASGGISWFAALVWVCNGRRLGLVDCAHMGLQGGCCVIAAVSLFDVVGGAALSLLASAAGTSPLIVQSVRRRAKRALKRRTDQQLRLALDAVGQERAWDELLAAELAQMTDVDLCWAWRSSYHALVERPDPAWRHQVARVRHAYLLELERRHPRQVQDWLATSPRPATGPERFLRSAADGDAPPP